MSAKPPALLPNHPFWSFSCQVYEKTQDNLLGLQTRYNLNINMLLFCLWFAANNHSALTKQDLKHLLTSIHTWHERIVAPLRSLRTGLNKNTLLTSAWAESVREEVLATELTAEHIEELLIIDAAPKKGQRNRRTVTQRAAFACQNISLYCQVLYIYPDEADCACLADILTAVFTELNPADALPLCRSVLVGKHLPNHKATQKQLQLELLIG